MPPGCRQYGGTVSCIECEAFQPLAAVCLEWVVFEHPPLRGAFFCSRIATSSHRIWP